MLCFHMPIYLMQKIKEGVLKMKIIKRDGQIVEYNSEKIRVAIQKANTEVAKKDKVSKGRNYKVH